MVLHPAPDVAVDVLHPEHPDAADLNDGSLVLRLRLGATSVLFTGDIEHGAERALLADRATLRSDVLKVPHHGSATSSTAAWLAAVRPSVAVISSGAGNRFGFPAPDVVRRLRAVGASVWNTAEQGAVRVVSDGNAIAVTSMRLPQHPSAAQRFEFPQLLW
jgi:competence protein ComEC